LSEPTAEEVETAIAMLKNGKAPGEDMTSYSITSELLIYDGKIVTRQLKQKVKIA